MYLSTNICPTILFIMYAWIQWTIMYPARIIRVSVPCIARMYFNCDIVLTHKSQIVGAIIAVLFLLSIVGVFVIRRRKQGKERPKVSCTKHPSHHH